MRFLPFFCVGLLQKAALPFAKQPKSGNLVDTTLCPKYFFGIRVYAASYGRNMSFLDILKVQKQGLEGLASVGTIGLHMVSGPLVGVVIGYFLDRWLETSPWFKLIFLFVGIGAGFLNVYMDSKMLIARMNRDRRTPQPQEHASEEEKTPPPAEPK